MSLGAATIIRAMQPDEVPTEVRTVIEAIQSGKSLSGQWHREAGGSGRRGPYANPQPPTLSKITDS